MSIVSRRILNRFVKNYKWSKPASLTYFKRYNGHSRLPNLNYKEWKKRQRAKNKMYNIKEEEYNKYNTELNALKDSNPISQQPLKDIYQSAGYNYDKDISPDESSPKGVGENRNLKKNPLIDEVKEDQISKDAIYGRQDLTQTAMKITGISVFVGICIMIQSKNASY